MKLTRVLADYGSGNKWVWSARPDVVLAEDGSDRSDLEPVEEVLDADWTDEAGWWTCHPRTKRGDLALIYRSQKAKDLRYIALCTSDAFSLQNDPDAQASGWDKYSGCRMVIVHCFDPSIEIGQLKNDPVISDWPALKTGFVRAAASTPDDVWNRVIKLAATGSRKRQPEQTGRLSAAARQALEKDLEEWLVANLDVLRPLGFDLNLIERQSFCLHHDGAMDLHCHVRGKRSHRVVIELKADIVRRDAIAQVLGYLGWLDSQPRVRSTVGLVIGLEQHPQVEYVLKRIDDPDVRLLNWAKIPLPTELAARLPS